MEKVKLLDSKKEWFYFLIIALFLISLQLLYKYMHYNSFKSNVIYKSEAVILNYYLKSKPDRSYYILKLQDENFIFYTSISKPIETKNRKIKIWIATRNIGFVDFLRGFYSPNIYYETSALEVSLKSRLADHIAASHSDKSIAAIFKALFLAIPVSGELKELFAVYGISHLIAISGFHLGVITAMVFGLFYYPYSFFQARYFPYRHRRNDLLLITAGVILMYITLIGEVASVIRAYVMFLLGFYYYRRHIALLSFENLAVTFILVLTLFPVFLFSYAFWFSIIGVFYIFLFLKYFQTYNQYAVFIGLNIWVFLAFNPIIHYFFGTTSWIQWLSPVLTMLFSLFYPLEILLHGIAQGNLLDHFLLQMIMFEPPFYERFTPFWFFVLYCAFSLLAAAKREALILLNGCMIVFNIYLYV